MTIETVDFDAYPIEISEAEIGRRKWMMVARLAHADGKAMERAMKAQEQELATMTTEVVGARELIRNIEALCVAAGENPCAQSILAILTVYSGEPKE